MSVRRSRSSLKLRLLALLLLLNLAVLGVATYALYSAHQTIQVQAVTTSRSLAQLSEFHLSTSFDKIDLTLLTCVDKVQHDAAQHSVNAQSMATFLRRQQQRVPDATVILLLDQHGESIADAQPGPPQKTSYADRDYFQQLRDNPTAGLLVSKPLQGRSLKTALLAFARRVNKADGSFFGVVVIGIRVDQLTQLLSSIDVGPHGAVALHDGDLGLITRTGLSSDLVEVGSKQLSTPFKQALAGNPNEGSFQSDSTGPIDTVRRTLSYHRLEKYPFYVLVGLAPEDYLASWRAQTAVTGALVLLFVLACLGLAGYLLRATAALEQSQQRLSESQHLAQLGHWEFDLQRKQLSWSDEVFRIFELDQRHCVPSYKTFVAAIHPDDRAAVTAAYAACTASPTNQQPHAITHRLRLPDGRIKYVHAQCATQHNAAGQPLRSLGTVQDVSASVLNEQRLEQALLEQQAILDNDMIGIVKSAQRVVRWANLAFEHMLGYGPGELAGMSTRFLYVTEAAFLALAVAADPVLAAGHVYRAQIELRRKDGKLIWVDMSGAMLDAVAGECLWVFLDITDRKAAEEKLRQFSRIVEQAPMSIVITDLKGCIQYANPWFSHVTGYALPEVYGMNPRMFQSGLTPPEVYPDMWQTLTGGGVWRGELHNHKKNHEFYIEQAVIAPVLDDAGQPTHYVALKEDISQRKQAEQALKTTLQEKIALLHEVHHRVKNNLQVITSLLRLEAGRTAEPTTKRVLKDMQGRIYSMALLHETLYRAGDFAAVELGAYLRQVATQAFRVQSGASGAVRLVLDLAPVQVAMDQATACGLLVNELLANCLKHGFPDGRAGEVQLQLQPVAAAPATQHQVAGSGGDASADLAASGLWRLCVRDTGVGLPADFDARRAESLGLQLVSDLTQQIGGMLEIGPGTGAMFCVHFAPETPTLTPP